MNKNSNRDSANAKRTDDSYFERRASKRLNAERNNRSRRESNAFDEALDEWYNDTEEDAAELEHFFGKDN